MKLLGFNSPEDVIGIDFSVQPLFEGIIFGGRVVGVVKDFNYTSLYHPIQPTVFFQKPIWCWNTLVKFDKGNLPEKILSLKKNWEEVYPDYPFNYKLLSDVYKEAYQKDILINKVLNVFSILCVLISLVGLFGVVSVILTHKTKEIGIRKVNGASVAGILWLINKDFATWVILAFILACPAAWYFSDRWMQHFSYRTEISWWVFALAGAMVFLLTFITISLRCIHAAKRNPVKALRYE